MTSASEQVQPGNCKSIVPTCEMRRAKNCYILILLVGGMGQQVASFIPLYVAYRLDQFTSG